ncbi:MAG: hypothetical protein AB1601_14780 [Planctomycetota bacterium]
MPDETQRAILRPPQATAAQWAELQQALADAVSLQGRLAAKSPYILQFTGPLQAQGDALFVPHEPATPWTPRELFDTGQPPAPWDQLVTVTAALLDALAAAHAPSGGVRPTVHGGLCPGVLLIGGDGLIKLTDFGFAPAVAKVFGADGYVNLAAGPGAAEHPAASGVWEIVPGDVIDRDDRLCAFVDPDKYGQGTLTTFEAGSDVIAAGFLLRLLAEHRHPYLFYEPDAHRVVDMAQMMSFGVPVPLGREDLARSDRGDIKAWCGLVAAMVARLPSERPSVGELLRRLKSFAPQAADIGTIKARRWVAQLEALRDAGAWRELEAALKDRPPVEEWPADLSARADALAQQVRDRLAEATRQAAIAEQHRTAQKWFERLRSAVQDAQWDAARKLLAARPTLEHWPEPVQRELEPLTAQVTAGLARQEAREWLSDLEADFKAKDWAAVGRRLDARPPERHWPPEVHDAVHVIEAAYRKHLDEQERERRRIASQHSEVRGWLERARALSAERQWVGVLDLLAMPPKVEHWPPGAHEEADRLAEACRAQLGDKVAANLEAIDAALARLATEAVEAVVREQLAGLLRPSHVEVVVENVIWGSEADADGHAPVRAALRATGSGPTKSGHASEEPLPHGRGPDQAGRGSDQASAPIRGELHFRLRGDEPQITRGLKEWREALTKDLAAQVGRLQEARLAAFERECRAGLFRQAAVAADLKPPHRQTDIHIALLGPGQSEGVLAVALRWDDAALRWQPADPARCRHQAIELATTFSRRAAWAAVLAASPLLRAYEPHVTFDFAAAPSAAGDAWPRSLAFNAKVTIRLGEPGTAETLAEGRVTTEQAGQVAPDADFRQIETRLARLVVRVQEESRKDWESRLKDAVRAAAPKAKLVAPGRIKAPVNDLTFEIRPKSGEPVTLTGAWDIKRLAFDLADWQATVAALAAPPPTEAPARAPPPAEPTPQPGPAEPPPKAGVPPPRAAERPRPKAAAPETPRPKPETGARRRPKGVMYGVAAASVVVVAIGLYLGLGGRGAPAAAPTPTDTPSASGGQTPVAPVSGGGQTSPIPEPDTPPSTGEPPNTTGSEPPVEPSTAGLNGEPEPVVAPPPRTDALTSLRTWWRSQSGTDLPGPIAAADALPALVPGDAAAAIAALAFAVDGAAALAAPQFDDEDTARVTLRANLKANGGPLEQAFVLRRATDDTWTPAAENAAALNGLSAAAGAALADAVARVAQTVADHLTRGELRLAHEVAAGVDEVVSLPLVDGSPQVAQLRQTLAAVPPPWTQVENALTAQRYAAAGGLDPATGYPALLRDATGRELVLVSLSPTDTLWGELAALGDRLQPDQPLHELVRQPANRGWHLFYVDADEYAADTPQAAAAEAARRGRRLPTRDEWFLAALRLRNTTAARELFGGLWEWCGGDDEGYWLCGGSRLLADRPAGRLRRPAATDDLPTWWAWLTHPLVMQQRSEAFGDGLAGGRTVLAVPPSR